LATLIGVGLVLGEKALAGTSSAKEWLGAAAVLASAFCGALCSVLYRPYLRKYPVLPVGALAMLASVGFLALLSMGEGTLDQVTRVTAPGWIAIGFIGVGSGLGYFLWLWALGKASATTVTVFLALSPLTAALLGAVLLDEPVPVLLWLGVACVALGLWLANRRDPVASLPS